MTRKRNVWLQTTIHRPSARVLLTSRYGPRWRDFDYYKNDFENYQDIADRKIGGITFHGRTYKHIGYDWIEYVAQIDDGRALSIGLRKLDCAPGTAPDVILSSMTIK